MTSNAIARRRRPPARSWNRPLLAILTCLLCALTLSSCARGTRPTVVPIPPELLALTAPVPPVTPDLTAPCPAELPPALDPSLLGLGRNHLQAAAIYHDCKARQRRLAAAARERERIEIERIERARRALERRSER